MTGISISTHVLDLDAGMPGAALTVSLLGPDGTPVATADTDEDGRVSEWPGTKELATGRYALVFDVGRWFAAHGRDCFYPEVRVDFDAGTERHYHVPLLLNRHGYTTYRGS